MNSKNIKLGVYGGLAGGAVFGAIMGMMGTLPMIGQMAGYPSAAFGFLVHMVISAVIGASFAILFGGSVRSAAGGLSRGLAFGGAWWLLGPLTLMPLFMGMGLGVNWNAAAASAMIPSLVGHLIYGGILGASYAVLRNRATGSAKSFAGELRPAD